MYVSVLLLVGTIFVKIETTWHKPNRSIFRREAEKKVESFFAALLRRSDYRSKPLVVANGADPDLYGGGRGALGGRKSGGKGFEEYNEGN